MNNTTNIREERGLRGADLRSADLDGADLRGVYGLRRLDEAIRETEKKLRDARTEEDMTRLARATGVYRDGGR